MGTGKRSIQEFCKKSFAAWGRSLPIVMIGLGALSSCAWDKMEPEVCFQGEVLPIFVSYCSTSGCHNPTDRMEGYDFTNYAGIMDAVSAGRPENSDVYEALTDSGDDQMPPEGSPRPTSEQIALIRKWIEIGADNTQNCGTVTCDTTATVTYSGDIQPMVQSNCSGCHSGGSASAGIDLTDYATVKQNATIGRIQGAMRQEPNYKPMPPNSPPLNSCLVDKIDRWVADGALNN